MHYLIDEISCGHDGEYVIELEVEVTHFDYQPPSMKSAWLCDNPDEYYGHTEIEWEVTSFMVYDYDGEVVAEGSDWPDNELYPFRDDAVEDILVDLSKEALEDY